MTFAAPAKNMLEIAGLDAELVHCPTSPPTMLEEYCDGKQITEMTRIYADGPWA